MSESLSLRIKLSDAVCKVPKGINSASIQKVRDYKKWVEKANKVLRSSTNNEQVLQSMLSQYEKYQ